MEVHQNGISPNLILNTFSGADELVINIFQFLSITDLQQSVMPTCHKWNNLARDDQLWKKIIQVMKPCLINEISGKNLFSQYVEFRRCSQNMSKNRCRSIQIKFSKSIEDVLSCTFRGDLYILNAEEIKKYSPRKKKFSTWKVVPKTKGKPISFQCDVKGSFLVLSKSKSVYTKYKIGKNKQEISHVINTNGYPIAAHTEQFAYWISCGNQVVQRDFWSESNRTITCEGSSRILKITASYDYLFVKRDRGILSIYSEKNLKHIATKKIAGNILAFTQEFIFAFCPRCPTFVYRHSISSQTKTVKLSLGSSATMCRGLPPIAQVIGDTVLAILYHYTVYQSRYGIISERHSMRSSPICVASVEILNFRTGRNFLRINYDDDTPKQLHSSIEKIVIVRSNTLDIIDFSLQKKPSMFRKIVSRVVPCI